MASFYTGFRNRKILKTNICKGLSDKTLQNLNQGDLIFFSKFHDNNEINVRKLLFCFFCT